MPATRKRAASTVRASSQKKRVNLAKSLDVSSTSVQQNNAGRPNTRAVGASVAENPEESHVQQSDRRNPVEILQELPSTATHGTLLELMMPANESARSQGNNVFDNTIDSHVPLSVRQKILSGAYVDLGFLLVKNPIEIDSSNADKLEFDKALGALVVKQKESTKKIYNIEQWTNAFIVYFSIYVRAFPNKVHELLSYLNTIRHASDRYGFLQAKNYDEQFRLRLARNPTMSWDTINPHLFLFTMPASLSTQNAPSKNNNPKAFQFSKIAGSRRKGFCHKFNDGSCQLFPQQCRFKHACESCGQSNHGMSTCRRQ